MTSNSNAGNLAVLGYNLPTRQNHATPVCESRWSYTDNDRVVHITVQDADVDVHDSDDWLAVYSTLSLYEYPHCYSVMFRYSGKVFIVPIFQLHRQCSCVVISGRTADDYHVIRETNVNQVCNLIAKHLYADGIRSACKAAAVESAPKRQLFPAYLGGSN